MPGIGLIKVIGTQEEGLQALFRTGNHGCVITEEKAAKDGYTYDG